MNQSNMQEKPKKPHSFTVRSRHNAEFEGINEVTGFDDGLVTLDSAEGGISVEGAELKIERFDAETGMLSLTGRIDAVIYFSKAPSDKKKSMAKFFK